jgi:hypothetical protein
VDQKVTGHKGLDGINLAQDSIQLCVIVNMVMEICVSYKAEISRVAERLLSSKRDHASCS